jgi:hypothetical protein
VQAGQVIDGKFRLIEELDAAGDVSIFLAEHTGIRRPVEIHLLAPGVSGTGTEARRLLREARVAGGTAHRNLQGVVDTGMDEAGRPYVVYERLRGRSLAELIAGSSEGLGVRRAARLMIQVMEVMRVLHEAGVVLRTLEPGRLTVEPVSAGEELVKLRGVQGAALLEEGGAEPVDIGVPPSPYLAPEIVAGGLGLDRRVDLFSAGVVLRDLILGRHGRGALSDTARRAIARACAVTPEERFASAEGMLQALALLLPSADRPEREQMPTPTDPLQADLQYLHLRRSADRTARTSLPGGVRVRLVPVLLTIEAIYRRFGEALWNDLTARMPDAEGLLPGAGNTGVNLAQGVAVELFEQLLREADDLGGRGDLGLVAEVGEAVAERGLNRLVPDFAELSPGEMVDGFPTLWRALTKDGDAGVHRVGSRGARLYVDGLTAPSLELAGFTAGLLRAALRGTAARHVEVVLIGSAALGDRRDLYGVEWR